MGKKSIFLVLMMVFFMSSVSAEIIINQQPFQVYNLGDIWSIPVTAKPVTSFSGNFFMDLICNGRALNFYKKPVSFNANEEKKIDDALLILARDIIGDLKGTCRIKIYFGTENVVSNEFKISNKIIVSLKTQGLEFNPGEAIYLEGEALKENGKPVNGFVEVNFVQKNSTANSTYLGTVNNGFFSVNFATPKETEAGSYLLNIMAYEKSSSEEITNNGSLDSIIKIKQVPTTLEIVFENKSVQPGKSLRVKTILHDQTGEKIPSTAILTIKDHNNKILEQTEKQTGEFLEYPVEYNQKPETWSVFGVSNRLSAESEFKISEKEDARIEVINKTLIVTNTGNIPYNETLLIKIGNNSVNVPVYLEVDETKKFLITAPDGRYNVQVINNGLSQISENLALTGKAIDVKEAYQGFFRKGLSLAWIFVIFVLALVTGIIFRKGYRKSFIGYIISKKKGNDVEKMSKNSVMEIRNRANMSLSMKGEKKSTVLLCLKIKNFSSLDKKDTSLAETLQKITSFAESQKAYIYESRENLFFIFSPIVTRTFKNSRSAIKTAQEIHRIIRDHNKLFKQKIEFGLGIETGEVLAKIQNNEMQFLAFGNIMNSVKKLASLSTGEPFVGEKAKTSSEENVKFEKKRVDNTDIYTVKDVREKPSGKFIDELVKRIERD